MVVHVNIDLAFLNKYYGPMHYKIGVKCVYNGHVFYVVITQQPNPPISQFSRWYNKFTSAWSMFPCNISKV